MRRLREWLNSGTAILFMQWVAGMAALKSADAANKSVSVEECDQNELPKLIDEARRYAACLEVMDEARSEQDLTFVTIQPTPVTKTENVN